MQIMVRIPSVDSDDESIGIDGEEMMPGKRKLKALEDWAIIEMQGDLESRIGDIQLEGKFVGDLHFTKAGQIPVLIIGHHILYGKVVKLEKPLVIMEKCQKQIVKEEEIKESLDRVNACGDEASNIQNQATDMEIDDMTNTSAADGVEKHGTVYNVRAIIRKKLLFKSRPKPIIANVPKKI